MPVVSSDSMPAPIRNAAWVAKRWTFESAPSAASATRVKSTHAVMSCSPDVDERILVRAIAKMAAPAWPVMRSG